LGFAFCGLEETAMTDNDVQDEDGAEWRRLPQAVIDWSSQPGPEGIALVDVGN